MSLEFTFLPLAQALDQAAAAAAAAEAPVEAALEIADSSVYTAQTEYVAIHHHARRSWSTINAMGAATMYVA